MARLSALTLLLAVLVMGCSPLSTGSDETVEAGSEAQGAVAPVDIDDRIVVATTDGSIAVYTGDGDEVVRIDPEAGSLFRWPTWLDQDTIVFSEADGSGAGALVAGDASSGQVLWRAEMDTSPFYYSPSPPGARFATTSLRNDPSGGLIGQFVDSEGVVSPLSGDSPIYTAWSPDGSSIATHIAGTSLSVFDGSEWGELLSPTGTFQAPSWTEHGLVTLRTVDGEQRLSVWSEGLFEDVVSVEGPTGFVAAGARAAVFPTLSGEVGAILASMRVQNVEQLRGERLTVVDLEDGSTELVSSDLVATFQWDQTGERLLFAAVVGEAGDARLEWSVWGDGESTMVASHQIQLPWARNLLPFQDQYAQSVRLWSPSGSRIAFPALVDGTDVVVIQPVDGTPEVIISDAVWSAWAPDSSR